MDVVVREAEAGDANAISRIIREAFPGAEGEVIEELPQPDVCNNNVPPGIQSDVEAIAEGFITITPLPERKLFPHSLINSVRYALSGAFT